MSDLGPACVSHCVDHIVVATLYQQESLFACCERLAELLLLPFFFLRSG